MREIGDMAKKVKKVSAPATRELPKLMAELRFALPDDVQLLGRGPFSGHILAACVYAMAREIPPEVSGPALERAIRLYGEDLAREGGSISAGDHPADVTFGRVTHSKRVHEPRTHSDDKPSPPANPKRANSPKRRP